MTTLEQLVNRHYATMSSSEKRVADVVLESGGIGIMASYTATELADVAAVSKPTVTRFVQKLGLPSFREFRSLARPLVPGSPMELLQRELSVTAGNLDVLVNETRASDVLNIQRTYEGIQLSELERVVDLLVGARELLFVDFRKNHSLAVYAATLLNAVRPRVRSLPEKATSPADGFLDLTQSDVVVMFPFRRAQQDHARTSQAVVDRGATLVTIGDRYPNPASLRADIHLSTSTDGPGVFDSLTAAMSLVGLVATAVANRIGEDAQERLDVLEGAHKTFDTFVSDVRPRERTVEDSNE
jgi:DNA-binding MurR/RpiR family transcriptional regulator